MKIKQIVFLLIIVFYNIKSFGSSCDPQPIKQCNQQCINDIQKKVDSVRVKNGMPGIQITLNFSNDKSSLLTFCSGTTTINGSTPINKDTLFEIGSTTKLYVAAEVLKLVDEHKISLNDKVSDWLGDKYPAWKNFTIDQLLHMTAGAFDYGDSEASNKFFEELVKNPDHHWQLSEITGWSYSNGPICNKADPATPNCPLTFGNGWAYSNTNYIIIEEIIEKVFNEKLSKKLSFQEIINNELIKPLSLNHTIYDITINPATIENMAHGYNRNPVRSYYNQDVTRFDLSWARADGAMIASTEDLSIWIRKLMNGNFISSAQLNTLINTPVCMGTDDSTCLPGKPLSLKDQSMGYSMGIIRQVIPGGIVWWHNGSTEGYHAIFAYFEPENFIVTAAANTTMNNADLERLAFDIYGMIFVKKVRVQN